MNQIALPLDSALAAQDDGYIVTDANAQAHDHLCNWQSWPHLTAILIGGKAAGKSAMAQQFGRDSGGHVVDDARDMTDNDLFHLWNRARQEEKPLLLVSSEPVSNWGVELPDLKSRLAASLLIEVGQPDEAMITGLFQKYFALRGLSISEDALSYLGKRMERSYQDVQLLAQNMNILAIERKKPITRSIAIDALAQRQADEHETGAEPKTAQDGKEG
ncbi:DnaA/Hda family protein [Sphingorhabdus sp. EL138]|uniref:DnaA ATPase domain-containing protein n=1 Tax=Sphingorhabdus sp. EL138 TaxID=2073156 RepID=UPI000D69B444|nr:DnaA/Hda family protein [Sphingorhabdus sp. EL138]